MLRHMAWVLVLGFGLTRAASAAVPDITAREFQLYMDWKDGKEDPRLAKDTDEVKLKKIAKTLGASPADVKNAIARVEPVIGTLKAELEMVVKDELAKTPIKPKVRSVEVNLDTAYPVAFVKWACGDARDIEKEAAYVAYGVAQGGVLIKTLGLWCVGEGDTKLFSAKIGRDAFTRIDLKAIERFATSRYIKLFEEVKRGPHT